MTVTPQDYIRLAQRLHPFLVIDTEPESVDITEDGLGAYVQAQVWIPCQLLRHSTPAQAGDDS